MKWRVRRAAAAAAVTLAAAGTGQAADLDDARVIGVIAAAADPADPTNVAIISLDERGAARVVRIGDRPFGDARRVTAITANAVTLDTGVINRAAFAARVAEAAPEVAVAPILDQDDPNYVIKP